MENSIHEIVIKVISGNASESEKKKVENWRREDRNEEIFRDLENIWHLSAVGKETFSPDTNKAWERLSQQIEEKKEVTEKTRKPVKRVWYYVAAAAAVIPFILFVALYNNNVVEPAPVAVNTVKAEAPVEPAPVYINEVVSGDSAIDFYLPDSSHVWLNKNSRFTWPDQFDDDRRSVNLVGEAFFDVKKDPSHPFFIYTENSITKVVGTSFNLKAYKGQKAELIVVSGLVEFSSSDNPEAHKVILYPKEKGYVDAVTHKAVKVKKKATASNVEQTWQEETPKSQSRFKRFLSHIRQLFKKKKDKKEQE
jgi:ferric-dicitrate binding protein FerR (iron transport regulator)